MTASNTMLSSGVLDLTRTPTIDRVGVEERVERLTKRSIKKESKVLALKLALSMIDLTTLEGADSPGKVRQMCYKAAHLHDAMPDLPHVAAVCVYPTLVRLAKEQLKGSGINVAAVATGFPSGQYPLHVKLDDTRFAVAEGADEIDMVISRGHFLAGDYSYVFDEIAAVKRLVARRISRLFSKPASSARSTTSDAHPTWPCTPAPISSRPAPA